MTHEDMFRLHLSGIGKYKDNRLIIDDFTSVEFIDGMNEYIVYDYCMWGKMEYITEYSYGERHGRRASYWGDGAIFSISNYANGELHGERVIYRWDGSISYKDNYTNGVTDEP